MSQSGYLLRRLSGKCYLNPLAPNDHCTGRYYATPECRMTVHWSLPVVRKSELFCSEGERRRLFSDGAATTSVRAAFYITDTKS